ncbi:sulfur carrier protein ThiS [Rhodoferax sediminis]|jgi:sulfur carrier protein|uniref:Sulfur carrier protein ThiS n=1 Tax=Rhodoferax sediminis TaxID=2509614 RepID=A0A515DAU7_9BURK|nr:sulfur carrier protein ThiS [Rhodoferax sediminis]QDL37548.1 sulfur carrier protein ThiS [Rhodoferax sediminis]
MNITLNKTAHEIHSGATLADALALLQPKPPFAVAVNMQFVPNTQYMQTLLQPGDDIEVIFPVTGG